ncbi:LytR/AlgR family response regulator transcription factor [Carboxylicivirga caseinilyticus]|uniref:LytR/AlgR family response regulator transcription factor n=1 Tax=Carboxylicivirga caseinilyticus TaxID=3417572 RepID=UPI003D34AC20|nr:LytTR family transcriptional regulator [Marinilabiliaceae bacterium A049]
MDFSRPIPGYLVKKQNIVRLILFTAAFALVFINIYSPFGVSSWFNISKLELLFYSSLVILTGVLVVVISRIIMYQLAKRDVKISLGKYLIWIAIEIVSMSLFYTFYELLILKDPRSFEGAIKASIQNTSLVLLLPYSTLWLYFSWKDNKEKLEELKSETDISIEKKGMVIFNDDKGTMRLTLKLEDLLYLKGADNYVTIYYNDHQKQEKFLLRNTLKQLEESLRPHDIIRCHRSYMINFNKVKLIERSKEGLRIRLDVLPVIEIPISKTYSSEVFTLFERNG